MAVNNSEQAMPEAGLAGSSPKRRTLFDVLQMLVKRTETTEKLVFGERSKVAEEKAPTPTVSKVDGYIRIVKGISEKLRGINTALEAF